VKIIRFGGMMLWLLCAALSHAQHLYFETLNTRQGLSSNDISCVYEDKKGFIWVGTRDGLNKFDGRVFKKFRNNPTDSNSLSSNNVNAIIQDAQGIFWIASKDGGLTRYDENAPDGQQFRQFKNNPKDSNSIATNRLICLYDWDENYLLIGAEAVPAIWVNKKTFQFSYWNCPTGLFTPKAAIPRPSAGYNFLQHVEQKDSTHIYMSFLLLEDLAEVNKVTGSIKHLHPHTGEMLSIGRFFIGNHKIWMSAWNPGLFVMDDNSNKANKLGKIDDLLLDVCDFNSAFLLAGTRSSGLYLVDKKNGDLLSYKKDIVEPHSLPSNKISCIFKDSRDIIWVGTSAGLAKYDKHTWLFEEEEFTDPLTDVSVLYSYRFPDGSVAVNTPQGMFLGDSLRMDFRQINFTNRGIKIVPDYVLHESGNKYLMGSELGFYEWERGTGKLQEMKIVISGKTYNENFYAHTGVYQVKHILPDTINGKPYLVLAVYGYGLAIYSRDSFNLLQFGYNPKKPHTLGSFLVLKVVKDSKGNLWIATSAGLFMKPAADAVDKDYFIAYVNEPGNDNSLPNNNISDIWCDASDHIWVSMYGGGALAEFDGKKFRRHHPTNPGSSSVFLGLAPDNHNRFWITTKNGLEVFDRSKKEFFHLDVNDGSANEYINAHFSNEENGWICFTSGNRIFSFRPDGMVFNSNFPELYLADMNVFGKSYLYEAQHGQVNLSARERFVNFTAGAIQFTSPGTVKFQYKLEGLDEVWNNSENGDIKYTNLPWGNFKLLVRVTNPAGQFSAEKVLVEFKIATPFYATWWFIALCLLFIAFVIYGVYRYRINQLLQLQKMRNKIARDLHDDIGSTLGSISFLSEAARQQLQHNNPPAPKKCWLKLAITAARWWRI
jgi:ligand-binding sensor domain-containing protein